MPIRSRTGLSEAMDNKVKLFAKCDPCACLPYSSRDKRPTPSRIETNFLRHNTFFENRHSSKELIPAPSLLSQNLVVSSSPACFLPTSPPPGNSLTCVTLERVPPPDPEHVCKPKSIHPGRKLYLNKSCRPDHVKTQLHRGKWASFPCFSLLLSVISLKPGACASLFRCQLCSSCLLLSLCHNLVHLYLTLCDLCHCTSTSWLKLSEHDCTVHTSSRKGQ